MAGYQSCSLQFFLLIIFIGSTPVFTAPYLNEVIEQQQQTQQQIPLDDFFQPSQGLIGPLYRENDHSLVPPPSRGVCHYQLRYYAEGERIDTKEPCLNCTCNNSMLMCYLKVCPFSKPIGKDCTVEKSPDQCCPVITCPQVPVNLQVMHMTSTTSTSAPISSSTTELVPYTEHGCSIEGQYYPDGAQVPGDHRKPCELCYCIRNHTACIMQECILKVEGCEPVFVDGICCPVRYKCAHDKLVEQITTTTLAPNGTFITTTIQPPSDGDCYHNNEFYNDGELIQSENPCKHCYCMNSDVVCAIQECRSPLDEEDENCTPREPPPGQCCPEAYDCPEAPEHTTLKYEPSVTEEVLPEVPEDKETELGELPVTSPTPDTTEKEELITKDIAIDTTVAPVKDVTTKDIELETTPDILTEEVKTTAEDIKIDTTLAPVIDEEKETIIDQTLSPVTVEEESDLDSTFDIPLEEDLEPTLDTTFGPIIEEEEPSTDTTLAPISVEEKEPSIDTTSAPVDEVEEDVDITLSPVTAEEKAPSLETTLSPTVEVEEPSIVSTSSPVVEDEEPAIYTTPSPEIKEEEIEKETTLATVIEDEKEPAIDTTLRPIDEEEEPAAETTLSPATEVEPAIDDTFVFTAEEEEPSEDTTLSPAHEEEDPVVITTLSPETEEKPVKDATLVPGVEEQEPSVDTTLSPKPEMKEPIVDTTLSPETEEELGIDVTLVPEDEEEKPSAETTLSPELEKEEPTVDTTLSPETEEEPSIDATLVPVSEEVELDVGTTVSPTIEEKEPAIETTSAPVPDEEEPSIDTTFSPAISEVETPSAPSEEEKDPIEVITSAPVTEVEKVTFEDVTIETTIASVDEEKEAPEYTEIDIVPVTTPISEELDDTVTETLETEPFILETRTSGLSPTTKPMIDEFDVTTLKSVDDKIISEEIQPSLDITTVPSELDTTEFEAETVSPESPTEVIEEIKPEIDDYPKDTTPEVDEHLTIKPEAPEILLTTESPKDEITSISEETATEKPELQERTTLLDKVDEQDTTVEVLASTEPSIIPEEETQKSVIEDELETETEYPIVDITTDEYEYEIKTTAKPLEIDESKQEVSDKPLVTTPVPEDTPEITTQVEPEEISEVYYDITSQPEQPSLETTEISEGIVSTKTPVSLSSVKDDITTSSVRPQVTEESVTTLEPPTEEERDFTETAPTFEGDDTSPELAISTVPTDSPTKLEVTPSLEEERVTTTKETIKDKEDEITIPELETEPSVLISEGNCDVNGTMYINGDDVPVLNNCQEKCMCKDSVVTCQFKACPSAPPAFLRCNPVQESDTCCPTFECEEFQTELEQKPSPNCFRNGTQYYDGEYVPSEDICTDCYCLYGEIVCAYIECPKYDEGCKPIEIPEGSCCPSKYECPELEVGDMTMDKEDGATTVLDVETTTPLSEVQTESTSTIKTFVPEDIVDITLPSELPETSTPTDEKPSPIEEEQDIIVTTSLPLEEEQKTTVSVSLPSEEEEITTEGVPSEKEQITTLSTPIEEETSEVPALTEKPETLPVTELPSEKEPVTTVKTPLEVQTSEEPAVTEKTEEELPTTEPEVLPTTPEIPAISEIELPSEKEPEAPVTTPSEEITSEEGVVTEKLEETSTIEPKIQEGQTTSQEIDSMLVSTPETVIEDIETTLLPDAELTTIESLIDETSADSAIDITESHITSTVKPLVVVDELTTLKEIDIVTTLKPDTGITDITTKASTEPELGTVSSEDTETTPPSLIPDEVTEKLELETTSVKDLEVAMEEMEVTSTHKPSPSPVDVTDSPLGTTISPLEEDITEKIDEITETPVIVDLDVTTKSTITDEQTSPAEPLTPESEEVTSEAPSEPDTSISTTPKSYDLITTEEAIETGVPIESKTTEEPYPLTTDVAVTTDESIIPGEGNCLVNGTEYGNGENVPKSSPCQEECKCKDSVVTCQLAACPAPPPSFFRCEATEQQADDCCPSFQCPLVDTDKEPSPNCVRNGTQYYEGDLVPSSDVCTDCYCLYEEIVCATLECPPIPQSCIRAEVDPGVCCPTKYECPEIQPEDHTVTITTEFDTSELDSSTVETVMDKEFEKEVPIETTLAPETEYTTTGEQDVSTVKDHTTPYEEETETDPQVIPSTQIPIKEVDTTDAVTTQFVEMTDKPSDISTDIPIETDKEETISTQPEATDKPFDISTVSPVETDEVETIYPQPEVITETHTEADVTELGDIETDTTTTPIYETYSPETHTLSSVDYTTGKYTTELEDIALDTTDSIIDETTTKKTPEQTSIPDKETLPTTLKPHVEAEEPPLTSTEFVSEILTERPLEETTTEYFAEETTLEPHVETEELTKTSTEFVSEKLTERPLEETTTEYLVEETTLPKEGTDVQDITEVQEKEQYKKCSWNSKIYEHGTSVPPDSECQDFCKCENGTVKCKHRACEKVPPSFLRCAAVTSNDTCCPVYDCGESVPTETFCEKDGKRYNNSDYVPSGTECLDCYCLDGEIVCASLECGVPRSGCTALVQRNNDCCPILYECDESPMEAEEFMIDLDEELLNATTAFIPDTDVTVVDDIATTTSTKMPSVAISSTPSETTKKPSITPIVDEDDEVTTAKLPSMEEETLVTTEYSISTIDEEETTVTPVKVDEKVLISEDKEDTSITDSSLATTIAAEKVTDRAPVSEITETPETEISEEPEISTEKVIKPTEEDDLVTKPIEEDDLVTKPTVEDDLVTKPTKDDDLVTKPTEEDDLVTKPTEEDDLVTKPTEEDDLATKATEEDDLVTKPTEEDDLATKPTEDDLVTKPIEEDDLVSVPEKEITTAQPVIDLVDEATTYLISEEDLATELSTEPALVASSTVSATVHPELKEPITDDKPDLADLTTVKGPEDDVPKETIPEVSGEALVTEHSTEPALIVSSTVSATEHPELKEPVTDGKPDLTPVKGPEDEVPKETMPEEPFPPFPGFPPYEEEGDEHGQTYLPPHESTTWKPTTTTELVIGPGNCLFDSKVYASAEQIPRDDPCDFCFCFRGDIICLQQTCPEPIYGCYEEAIPGFCCPRYECPVRQEFVNVTTTTPSPFPGFPPSYKTSRIAMCEIEGRHYASGEVVKSASSPCHECICGSDGFMKCIPKECDTKRKIYKYGYR